MKGFDLFDNSTILKGLQFLWILKKKWSWQHLQRPLVQVMQKSTQSDLDPGSKRMEKTKIGILILIGALVAITVIVAISVVLVSGTIHFIQGVSLKNCFMKPPV